MKKKILTAALAVCMLATLVIGMSLAYFTDTESKTNTFTVGNVDITLTEPGWLGDTSADDVRLIPGKTIAKDPTIKVAQSSQTAYTFMKVQLSPDFQKLITDWATAQNVSNPKEVISDWFSSTVKPKIMAANIEEGYVILGVLSPKAAGESVTYFDKVTVPATVTQDMIKADGTYTIDITAYAIQAEGFYTTDEPDAKQAARAAAFEALFPDETLLA